MFRPPPALLDVPRSPVTALRSWGRRRRLVAAGVSLGFGLVIGLSTVLIPNPVFARDIPVVAWNYPVWILTSVLVGLLAATYVRQGPASHGEDTAPLDPSERRTSRMGMAGGVLTWFAVGCPVCNKLALLALGYSGALTWFAPVQPFLAVGALVLTAWALVVRLRGEVACPLPAGAARA
ncbi:hypothetical protein V2J52_16170 [Georgenia sp. MJ173]|uniref:hypothetical protein n=1 Tax=Georgenia sunbinii TaxID=3117728 RepID=UPI002F26D6C4